MACFLLCWFVFYAVVVFLASRKTIRLLKLDSNCMLLEAPHAKAVISFGFGRLSLFIFVLSLSTIISVLCIADQCILWGLTAYKYRDVMRLGLSTNPLLRLVMRDTSWSCLAICCKQQKHLINCRFYILACFLGVLITTMPYHFMIMRVTHIIYW